MGKKIYVNENTRFFNLRGIPIVANLDNASIIGLSARGAEFWQSICKDKKVEGCVVLDNAELYKYLVEYEMLSEEPIVRDKNKRLQLKSAYLHVTTRCNLHCIGCYSMEDRDRNMEKEPSTEELKIALWRLSKAGVSTLVISGGEPFIRQDLYELLRYAKDEAHIENIIVITNGTVKVDFSIFLPVIDSISVSVDGFNEEHATFIRDEGIINKIIDTVRELKRLGFSVGILPTLHKKNTKYMEEYKRLSEELGVDLGYSLLSVCDTPETHDFIPEDEELRLLAQNLLNTDDRVQDFSISKDLQAGLTCGAGRVIISISTDGNVYPCHMLHVPELKLGNIFINPLNDEFVDTVIIDEFQGRNVETNPDCNHCDYKYLCSGGCKTRAFFRDNNIRGKDSYCELSRYFYEKVTDELLAAVKKNGEIDR